MKEDLLKIAQESITEEEVGSILRDKFKKAIEDAVENAFRFGDAKHAIEDKVKEVMVPYIKSRDFTEYLPKLDAVLTEIVNSDACLANKDVLQNFRDLLLEPEQKEIKVTEIFKAWIRQCEKDINTDDLGIDYDDGVSYSCVNCEMRVEEMDRPSWSSFQRAIITFENENDEELNIEIPISKLVSSNRKEEPYSLSITNDISISSLRRLNDFQILLLRLERAGTAIIIDKEYDDSYIQPEKEPEATFS